MPPVRHILVTGAGGGLGAAVCDLLARRGDTVFATDADIHRLRLLQAESAIVRIRMDVTDPRDIERAVTEVALATDGLDGIVCSAGIFRAGSLVEIEDAVMTRSIDVNVMGAFRTVRAFFPLLARRRGRVILIGTEMTDCPMPFTGPYSVSKCALQAYADTLRRELMLLGMRVVVLQPGAIRTPLLSGAGSSVEAARGRTLFPAQLDIIDRMLPREWERGSPPAEVARVVVKALRAKRPRIAYRVGVNRLRGVLGVLPAPWVDTLLKAYIRISPARGASERPPAAARR